MIQSVFLNNIVMGLSRKLYGRRKILRTMTQKFVRLKIGLSHVNFPFFLFVRQVQEQ